jgi:hypothetical protein
MHAPDPEELEQQFVQLLAAYDEALAAGRASGPEDDLALPEPLRPRLRRARACLQLLEAVWPRTRPSPPGTFTADGACAEANFDVTAWTPTGPARRGPGSLAPEQACPSIPQTRSAPAAYPRGAIRYVLATGQAPFCGPSLEEAPGR